MNKELLISIKPEHLVDILNGKKTLELRKTVPKDYKGWVNIYCTKGIKDILYKYKDKYYTQHYLTFTDNVEVLNSKVVARFWFDEYDSYCYGDVSYPDGYEDYDGTFVDTTKYTEGYYVYNEDLERLCLTYEEVEEYGKGKDLYAWHIKKLEIFDEPKELGEFYKGNRYPNGEIITPNICEFSPFDYDNDLETCLASFRLQRPPQSYQFVYTEVKENDRNSS